VRVGSSCVGSKVAFAAGVWVAFVCMAGVSDGTWLGLISVGTCVEVISAGWLVRVGTGVVLLTNQHASELRSNTLMIK
jgi:hypothetical protein